MRHDFSWRVHLLPILFLILGVAVPAPQAAAQSQSQVMLLIHLDEAYKPPTSLGCDGGYAASSAVNPLGALNTDYYAFVVAANVDTSQGMLGASFGIYYHPGDLDGLNIASWTSLGQGATPSANWPDPGSSMTVSFFSCRGKTADPADTYGRGLVVLGYFQVSATSEDYLMIVPKFDEGYAPMTITTCSLGTQWVGIDKAGSAGFKFSGANPCEGAIDRFPDGCCVGGECQVLDRLYCDYLGGIAPTIPLTGCSQLNCTTPVRPTTWGRIKSTYH